MWVLGTKHRSSGRAASSEPLSRVSSPLVSIPEHHFISLMISCLRIIRFLSRLKLRPSLYPLSTDMEQSALAVGLVIHSSHLLKLGPVSYTLCRKTNLELYFPVYWRRKGQDKQCPEKSLGDSGRQDLSCHFRGADLREVYGGSHRVILLDKKSSIRSGFYFEMSSTQCTIFNSQVCLAIKSLRLVIFMKLD